MVLIRKESLIAATCGGSDKCRIPGADARRVIQSVGKTSIITKIPIWLNGQRFIFV